MSPRWDGGGGLRPWGPRWDPQGVQAGMVVVGGGFVLGVLAGMASVVVVLGDGAPCWGLVVYRPSGKAIKQDINTSR